MQAVLDSTGVAVYLFADADQVRLSARGLIAPGVRAPGITAADHTLASVPDAPTPRGGAYRWTGSAWQEADAATAAAGRAQRLAAAKEAKRVALRAEALARAQALFPAIRDADDLALLQAIVQSIAPAARQPTDSLAALLALRPLLVSALAAVRDASSAEELAAVTLDG